MQTEREQGLFMGLWIILSWKGSMRLTESGSAVESRQILQALEGALPWGFVQPLGGRGRTGSEMRGWERFWGQERGFIRRTWLCHVGDERRLHLGETSVSWERKISGKASIRCGEGVGAGCFGKVWIWDLCWQEEPFFGLGREECSRAHSGWGVQGGDWQLVLSFGELQRAEFGTVGVPVPFHGKTWCLAEKILGV